jgi:hypothetical protein
MSYSRRESTPFVVDIETVGIPVTEEDEVWFLETWSPPKNISKPETIEARRQEALSKWKRMRAVHPGQNKIIAIGVQNANIEDGEPSSKCGDNEGEILDWFCQGMRSFGGDIKIVGYNLKGFDLPTIAASMYRHGITSAVRFKRWDIVDLFEWPLNRRDKLKKWLYVLGIDHCGLNGGDVAGLYRSKNWALLEKYCNDDVRGTTELYRALSTIYEL